MPFFTHSFKIFKTQFLKALSRLNCSRNCLWQVVTNEFVLLERSSFILFLMIIIYLGKLRRLKSTWIKCWSFFFFRFRTFLLKASMRSKSPTFCLAHCIAEIYQARIQYTKSTIMMIIGPKTLLQDREVIFFMGHLFWILAIKFWKQAEISVLSKRLTAALLVLRKINCQKRN